MRIAKCYVSKIIEPNPENKMIIALFIYKLYALTPEEYAPFLQNVGVSADKFDALVINYP